MNAARWMSVLILFLFVFSPSFLFGQRGSIRTVTFPSSDGGTVEGDLYGSGTRGVVLAHGAVFDKSSWDKFAESLSSEGLQVLAINFRDYGKSLPGSDPHGLYRDVLAAIRYLRENGIRSVSIVGASMGGSAAALAAVEAPAGEIDRLALLSPVSIDHPERMKAQSFLFVTSQDECLMPQVKEEYEAISGPKKLEVLPGNAHAQHIFASNQGEKLTKLLVQFLTAPER